MSKQTAVEWLVEQYAKSFKISVNAVMGETIEQAKVMEKEQIIDAACEFMGTNFDSNKGRAELYYKGTYVGDK